jgi:ribosomal-protein-alanine N-acetyltransferase
VVQIKTERLLLRDFEEEDWRSVYAYMSNPAHKQYYHVPVGGEENVRRLVNEFIEWSKESPRNNYQLAIVLPDEGRVIGSVGLRVQDAELGEADLGVGLDPSEWNQGYAVEAATRMLDYAFEELKFHRVCAECIADNESARKLVDRLGMREEGRFKNRRWMNDKWWDSLLFAILDSEWHARK